MTQAAMKRKDETAMARRGLTMHQPTPGGWVEDLGADGLQLRCITGFNSGPPMTPGGYNQNVQVFQTPEYVVLLNEMNHNARIVPLDERAHIDLPQWTGDSRGHWEGGYARHRNDQFPPRDELRLGTDRCTPASHRTLDTRVLGDTDVRSHD